MSAAHAPRGPRVSLVYGLTLFHGGSLAVVEQERLISLARDIRDIKQASTFGELRAAAARLSACHAPASDEQLAAEPDDAPFRWSQSPDWLSGAWPPLPTSEIYRVGQADPGLLDALGDAGVRLWVEPSARHGWGAKIDPAREDDLVRVLRGRRYWVRRDDEMLDRLSWDDKAEWTC